MLNPVLRREILTVFRARKTFILLTGYVLGLLLFCWIYSLLMESSIIYRGYTPSHAAMLYQVLFGIQLGIVMLIVPALTAGSISGERERQTLDLLLITKMSTFDIVFGKMMSSILVVLLMIFTSMPVFGIALYYGGASITGLFGMTAYTILVAAFVGSVSIFFSTIYKKTVIALVMTYTAGMILIAGSFFVIIGLLLLYQAMNWATGFSPVFTFAVLSVNPVAGFISIIDSQTGAGVINSFITGLVSRPSNQTPTSIPLWVFNSIFNVLFILLLTFLSSHFIKPVKKSRRLK